MSDDSDPLEKLIAKLKGPGFWCKATESRLRGTITMMRAWHVADTQIAIAIENLWVALEAEYAE